MFSKKGQAESEEYMFFTMLWLILVGLFGLGMFWYVASNVDNTYFWKNFYSKDIALTEDALHGVQGNADFIYKIRNPNHHFEYELQKGKVNTYLYPRDLPSSFFFATNNFITLPDSQSYFTSFVLKKENNAIIYGSQEPPSCPGPNTVDAAYVQKKYYIYSANSDVNSRAFAVSRLFMQYLSSVKQFSIASTPAEADLIIIIDDKQTDTTAISYAYTNAKSAKLACLVQLSLQQANPSIISSSKSFLPTENVDAFALLERTSGIIMTLNASVQDNAVIEQTAQAIEVYYT